MEELNQNKIPVKVIEKKIDSNAELTLIKTYLHKSFLIESSRRGGATET